MMAQAAGRRRRRGLSALQRSELRRELERELRRIAPAAEGVGEGAADRVVAVPPGRARQLVETLRRMATPEFGVCRRCRDGISYQRLSVLPETTLCASCSRQREGSLRW
jgi:RNA polymerase-binding transcription factor DksA